MKILAIRGQNLASLAGRFEVALDDGPLAEAGLFAIVGETGAGKTTLLDAMCAALFDKTPRLEGHSSFKVGHGGDVKQRLGTADVRALVRNGEAAGWAEVDFEGRDRRRYRSRWEVQRARKKLDGNWQDQRMTLVRLDDGQVLGGTRTETLAAIRQVLGLSYDEFCRSALLAQFQFARFLKASASERAELLERMTGTRIYGDVSIAAHLRARALGEERRRLGDALAAIRVLDDAQRAALAVEETAARRAAARGRDEQVALAGAASWRARAAALAAQVAGGERALAEAQARRAAAAGVARELAAVERAAPVRAPWAARGDAARRLVLVEQAVSAAAGQVRSAAAAEAAAAERARAASAKVAEVRALAEQAAPALAQARVLDVQVAAAARAAEAAAAAAAAAALRARDASARVATLDEQLAAAEAAVRGGEAWLGARPARALMARDPARWRAALGRAATAQSAAAVARATLDGLTPRLHDAQSRLDAAARELTVAHMATQQAESQAAAAEQLAQGAAIGPAERAAAVALERARRIEVLAAVVRDAASAAGDERTALDEAAGAQAIHDAAELDARSHAALIDREGAALREAENTLVRLRTAAGHDQTRAELVDGEPCPVCGAAEHPWTGGIVDTLVAEQHARVSSLRELVEAARRALRDAERVAQSAAARAAEHVRAAASAASRRTALDTAWRSGLVAIGELPLVASPVAPEAATWIAAAAAESTRAATAAEAARDAARALHDEVVARTSVARAAAHTLDLARDARDRVRDEVAALSHDAGDAARTRDESGRQFDDVRAELHAVLSADELRALERDAAALRDAVDDELSACVARLATIADARARAEQIRPELAALRATSTELATAHASLAAAAASSTSDLSTLRTSRAALLSGRAADTVERELHTLRDAAAAEAQSATTTLSDTGRTHSSAIARRDAALTSRTETLADHTLASSTLAAALSAAGLDESTATSLLARDATWISTTRTSLAALDAAVGEASAVAADRHRQSAEHAAARPAVLAALTPLTPSEAEGRVEGRAATELLDADEESFGAIVTAVAHRAESAASRLAEIEVERRADEAARAQHGRAAAALAELHTKALPYEQLAELIGSADGKELRNFAQSLSLDALLAAANRHLDQLAPRYQLGRVPGLDLELHVVDREMAGDARAVNGLSGGESFLVSLALALGLSSMAAADVEVRTLFIDEGFGSLDPATLDAALGVLDTLRASGRQVGIVSHVAELEDRVAASIAVRAVGGGRSVVQVRSARA